MMIRDLARGLVFSLIAMALGCGVVWWAVSTWTSLSSRWIGAGFVAPIFGLHLALFTACSDDERYRGRLRLALTLVAACVCTAGNYLAFVITSRTWFLERIAAEHRDFFHLVTHPSALPTFVERAASGGGSEQTWQMYVVVGLLAGPFAFWFTTKKN
jgi:hypothetical protein